jgi:serine/threonine protein phosphatase PrpC
MAETETQSGRTCATCGETLLPDDRFCEGCGADLLLASGGSPDSGERAAGACPECGHTEFEDGFCTRCGHAKPATRDRVELDLGAAAGVSDRGLRHHRNEDALALRVSAATPGGDGTAGVAGPVVVVVCDGVSTSDRPDDAAKAAADHAADVLLMAAREGTDLVEATGAALAGAGDAVTELAGNSHPDNAPACTIVSAVVTGDEVTVGWVGDSRAYWLGEADGDGTGPERLTTDDSWAERMVSSGRLTEAEALEDPRSHALVAWLGADAGEVEPHVRTFRPGGPGVVLVCSDGLWNYVWDAGALAHAVLPAARTAPFQAAAALTRVALDGGGHDNITVAVVPFPPAAPDSDQSPPSSRSATA